MVEEGDLEVGRILDLQAAINPVTSTGPLVQPHRVTYPNWGNSASYLRLTVSDKDDALGFRLAPEQVAVPVGGTATARLRVRPRKPFLRGAPVHRPFQVVGEPAGSVPAAGHAAFRRRPGRRPRAWSAGGGRRGPAAPDPLGGGRRAGRTPRGRRRGVDRARDLKSGNVLGAPTVGTWPEAPTQLIADAVSAN